MEQRDKYQAKSQARKFKHTGVKCPVGELSEAV